MRLDAGCSVTCQMDCLYWTGVMVVVVPVLCLSPPLPGLYWIMALIIPRI